MIKNQKIKKIIRVKGMNDILPIDTPLWELFENVVNSIFKKYGFQQIRTPIVELTTLFSHSLGAVTDIVEKEMYSFTDTMNGDNLTLRPENTASVIRATLEHNLIYDGPKRLWYIGPMFRHERTQRGRYRQFHQVGVEAIGLVGPDIDAELIILCKRLWCTLGLKDIYLELNSIGNIEERNKHRTDLIIYLKNFQNLLDVDAQRRLYSNPLRILDSKNPLMQNMLNAAPKLLDYLGTESLAHFELLQKILHYNNVQFTINPRLVRGMDYYNSVVFEWITNKLGTQSTVCGGGRYDSLIKAFGGKQTSACGFAIGVERILEIMKMNNKYYIPNQCDVYLVYQGEEAQLSSFILAEKLRDLGLHVMLHYSIAHATEKFKSQMKKANASGATFAIIIGENEIATTKVTIKKLRTTTNNKNNQITIPLNNVSNYLIKHFMKEYRLHDRFCT